MAFDVMIPLREALETLSHDNDVRVVVLTGAGHGFCSGADLEDSGIVPNIDGLTVTSIARRALELLDDVIIAVRKMHQPVIGAINGAAIGGGFCLACACDIRVASDARLLPRRRHQQRAHRERARHLVPAPARDRLGARRSTSCSPAATSTPPRPSASAWCRASFPPRTLLDECYAIAERIIGFSRVGVEVTKRMLWSSLDASSLSAHMDHEGIAQLYVRLTTQNFEEAIRARKEKRTPEYRD